MLRVGGDEPPSILSDTLPPPLADSLSPWVRASSQGRARSGSTPAGRMPTVQALLGAPDCNAWVGRHRRAGRPGVTPGPVYAASGSSKLTSHRLGRLHTLRYGCEVRRRGVKCHGVPLPLGHPDRPRGVSGDWRVCAAPLPPGHPTGLRAYRGTRNPARPCRPGRQSTSTPSRSPRRLGEPNIRAVPAWSRKGKGP